jgi:hypothetical protein
MPKRQREQLHVVKLDRKGKLYGRKDLGSAAADPTKTPPFQVARRANHRCRRATLEPSGEEWQPIVDDPNLSESTKKSYHKALSIILGTMSNCEKKEVNVRWVLPNPELVLPMLKREYENPSTRKAMLVPILGLFKRNQTLLNSIPGRAAYKMYSSVHKELHDVWSERVHSMVPTQRETDAFVTWEEVLAAEKRLATEAYGSFSHLVLAMYSLIEPLRSDFNEVKLVHKDLGADAKHPNFLVLPTGTLVISEFKTAKTHGPLRRSLPSSLLKIFKHHLLIPRGTICFATHGGSRTQKTASAKPVTACFWRYSTSL